MLRPPKLRPSDSILEVETGHPLVKSPGSYTSPDNYKSTLFGTAINGGKGKPIDLDYSRMDPDDMFVHHSVAEIRAIRARLLADADGKREELRQMVGERYRDLLHASTAITNMAGTSERVVGTLVEMRDSCTNILHLDESPRARHRPIPGGKATKSQEDVHLKTLQILSAHLKLLLDSPEHLWRWLEKKQFLHAAWLFLLARTVYRKLSKSPDGDDSEEEEPENGDIHWSRHGIEVMEQFPIASRQWDAIGQFRPQIVHKATQALREADMSHRETAETLIAILLLDALSITRTRGLFLSQRSKTLTTLLNPPLNTSRRGISPNRAQNRKATAALLSPAASPSRSPPSPSAQLLKTPISATAVHFKTERKIVRGVVKTFRAAISLVGGTVATAGVIYGANGLLAQIITDIQTDVTPNDPPPMVAQLQFTVTGGTRPSSQITKSLTTPQILHSLPSASLLLRFLPSSIIRYTPYVSTDPDRSGTLEATETEKDLDGWLNDALEALAAPARTWLSKLDSVHAVWAVRGSIVNGIMSLEVTNEVKKKMNQAIEAAFFSRVTEVWENRLESIEAIVGNALSRAIALLEGSGEGDSTKDLKPLNFIYASELPLVRVEGSGDASFRMFETTLKNRASRRTPLLDSLLSEMEMVARDLYEELIVTSGEGTASEINTRLISTYQPRAGETCMRVVNILSSALDHTALNKTSRKVEIAVFIGRLANALVTHSPFITNLSCSRDAAEVAMGNFKDLHRKSLHIWSLQASANALEIYQSAFKAYSSNDITLILRPSSQLMSALMSLMSFVDSLGMTLVQLRDEGTLKSLLTDFENLLGAGIPVEHVPDQVVWDLMFLREIQQVLKANTKNDAQSPEDNNMSKDIIYSHLKEYSTDKLESVKSAVRDQLARSQLLLSTLLDARTIPTTKLAQNRTQNAFLPLGVPPAETDFRSALDLVKPCQRFGMLPVVNTQVR